jgi:superfamily II DNA helicase RecQ
LRRELAAEAQVPPYVIFHDATLREMAVTRPATLPQLAEFPASARASWKLTAMPSWR